LLTREFDYDLPEQLIAQHPIEPRDASRLLVVHRTTECIEHRSFRDILEYLVPGDLLIGNASRVIPARLQARKVPSGGRVEILLLRRVAGTAWEALVKGRRVDLGQRLAILPQQGSKELVATVEEITEAGGRLLRFAEPLDSHLDRAGIVPLPPYIHAPLVDPERYQTVYARERGSVAAPTAGLHLTPELLAAAQARGVGWATVLLHIGLDTFRPVSEERAEEHHIHTEHGSVSERVAEAVNAARGLGKRVVAVGTTTVRVLETAASPEGVVHPWQGNTNLYIMPGYRFRAVDALVTNFHLPRSTLLMLVAAFAGLDLAREAYRQAIAQRYRFYSFGDAMLIL
jgi:S-adenosylmethionine:tRNA ribosyltransferase-isomerase